MLKCRYCGYKGNKEEFETTQDGYWCPDCDGFTLYSKDDEPKYWIILEDKNRPGIHISGSRNISPLRYPGGKTRIAPYLSSLCRQSHLTNFCEPFCGSASVGLYMLISDCIENLYLNDLDHGIYALFTVIKDEKEYGKLRTMLEHAVLSRKWFYEARDKAYEDYQGLSMVDTAFTFLTLNRMAYSGIITGGCMSDANARWNPKTIIKRLDQIHAYADRIHIYKMDALAFIEEYYWLGNNTMFIDPPYFSNNARSLYSHYYTEQDHRNLSDLLNSLYTSFPCTDMIITYDFCKEIRDMYPLAESEIIGRNYTI